MIIITLILCTFALFLSSVFGKGLWRGLLMTIFGLGFIASIVLIVQNDHNHFGMKTVTETKSTTLVSSADSQGLSMLLYHPLGNGTEKVYLYRTNNQQAKPKATQTENTTNQVKVVTTPPKLVTTTKYRVYKNKQAKFWFGIAGNNHEFVSRNNRFEVNQNWLTLSDQQAKQFAKKAAQQYQQQAIAKVVATLK